MDLEELKRLAGVKSGVYANTPAGAAPEGPNISKTGTEKREIEREMGLRPGDPEWFELWFTRPYLTDALPPKFRGRK